MSKKAKYTPLAVVVGVSRPEDQVRYQEELKGFDVKFPESDSAAIGMLPRATVLAATLAVAPSHKSVLETAVERGFEGYIVPIMSGKHQEFIPPKGKRIPAIACRHAPAVILKHLKAAAQAAAQQ